MDASIQYQTQIVGALPAITAYFDQLDLAATIDQLVPWEGEIPLGTLVEVLITNRLPRSKALFRVGEWAQAAALTDYYDLTAEQLNDDRLGRALERLPKYAETIQAALVLTAIEHFQLDVHQVHYDISNVELYGAYEDFERAEDQAVHIPLPTYGRTKSGRKHVKQIQFGLDVTGAGGVPVGHRPLDGNAAEVHSHRENLQLLGRVLPKGKLLYIAATKLDAPENLLSIAARKGQFLGGGVRSPQFQERYLQLRDRLHRVHYFPQSQAKLPPGERDQYKAVEITEHLEGTVDEQRVRLDYRLIFVGSGAKARQEAATRQRHVAKVRTEFEAVERNLGRYSLKTTEAIVRRLETAKEKSSEGELFDYHLEQDPSGQFRLDWGLNAAALQRWEALEGVYALKTNLPRQTHRLTKVLRMYKEQSPVERRFHHLKGPLAVPPRFLKNPERIAGWLCILVWALTVLALMERQVRRELKGEPLYGLYPENRPGAAPTGPALVEAFSRWCIVIIRQGGTIERQLAEATPVQHEILKLLGVHWSRLRTFRRRCGT